MNTATVLIPIAAWLTFNAILMLVRMPFSHQKIARLKAYGLGVVFMTAIIILGYAWGSIMNSELLSERFTNYLAQTPQFVQMLLVIGFMAIMTMSLAMLIFFAFGHMASLMAAWMASDDETMFANL